MFTRFHIFQVARDRALKSWKFPEGIEIDNWGSGYPGGNDQGLQLQMQKYMSEEESFHKERCVIDILTLQSSEQLCYSSKDVANIEMSFFAFRSTDSHTFH